MRCLCKILNFIAAYDARVYTYVLLDICTYLFYIRADYRIIIRFWSIIDICLILSYDLSKGHQAFK